MNNALICLIIVVSIWLSACAQTHEEVMADTPSSIEAKTNQDISKTSVTKGGSPLADSEFKNSGESEVSLEKSKVYWVKKPGTLVYNEAHDIIRSLRLQPQVTIYKEVEGWGLIDPAKDEWVNLSDVTLQQPSDMLARPEESTERPRITVEEMMKDAEK